MTASRDPDRMIHAFLREGEEELQDQVYDAVRAEIERKPQRAGLHEFLRAGPTDLPRPSFDAVRDRTEQTRQRVVVGPWRVPEVNKFLVIGGGAAAAVVVAVIVGVQLLTASGAGVVPGPTATPEASMTRTTAEPTPSSSPSARSEEEVIKGWPQTLKNPAGIYSWDRTRCAGQSCNVGFMHNGYGSGDIDITIQVGSASAAPDDGTPVTVAGHDGVYRRIDAQHEQWIVEIEGRTVAINITAEIGTSQADIEEAHAIIDSMRTEPVDALPGFRIVFTLTTDDWDSG